jgi:hypothetical protein
VVKVKAWIDFALDELNQTTDQLVLRVEASDCTEWVALKKFAKQNNLRTDTSWAINLPQGLEKK